MIKQQPKKIKDKWKSKEWYKIYAPDMFNKQFIGETLSGNPDKLIGRTREVLLQELTGDFSKAHIKLIFQVKEVKGYDVYTEFLSHCTTSDYIRRLIRRRKSKIDLIYRSTTKDGVKLKVSIVGIADKRIKSSQKTKIRNVMGETVLRTLSESTLPEFIRSVLYGDLTKKLSDSSKHIYPLKKIEVYKSEVITDRIKPEEKGDELEEIDKEMEKITDVGVAQTGGASDS